MFGFVAIADERAKFSHKVHEADEGLLSTALARDAIFKEFPLLDTLLECGNVRYRASNERAIQQNNVHLSPSLFLSVLE